MLELNLTSLRQVYQQGLKSPSDVIRELYSSLDQDSTAFICLTPLDNLLEHCAALEKQEASERGALWGIPFAVKDNVDVQGYETTATCPSFKYMATRSAPAIDVLLKAGAIMVGKTNMDQFASGLVGTRSPYGVPVNAFDHRFIPGGSSSGSGSLVGRGLVCFAIGTDTAGSGRVPAGLNGCVGIKPTVGSISTVGVVPACASLDCLSVFAHSVKDGAEVAAIMRTADVGAQDVWRRTPKLIKPPEGTSFRFGVPSEAYLDFDGPGGKAATEAARAAFQAAVDRLTSCGGQQEDIDWSPFAETAALLYQSSFVAERYSGIRGFLDHGLNNKTINGPVAGPTAAAVEALQQQASLVADDRLLPVTRAIISGAGKFTATDVFDDNARLAVLRAKAREELKKVDVLLVPTALEHYLKAEIDEEESGKDGRPVTWTKNAKHGRFTNFVNLLDLCAVSVPSGLLKYDTEDSLVEGCDEAVRRRVALLKEGGGSAVVALPFGVTLISHCWWDEWLAGVAEDMSEKCGLRCGPSGHGVTPVSTKGP